MHLGSAALLLSANGMSNNFFSAENTARANVVTKALCSTRFCIGQGSAQQIYLLTSVV